MVTQNTTTAGAASAARHIQLTEPQANQQIVIDNIAGAALDMGFPSEAAQLEQSGQDLVFLFENGGRIVLSNFFGLFESNQLPAFNLEDGQTLPGDAFLAALREDLLPAAGPGAGAAAGSGGVGDYDDNAGDLIGGVDRLDPLGTGTFGVTPLAGIEDEGLIDPAGGTLLISLTTGISTTIGENGNYPEHPDAVPPGTYVGVFEDWEPNQHLGSHLAFQAAFGFTFTPDDNEVLNTITFTGPIDGHLLVNGVEVLPDGAGNFVIAAADLGNVTLLPNADSGTDIPLSGFATITDPDSGLTGTVPFGFTAVVDAVADQPIGLHETVNYGPFYCDHGNGEYGNGDGGNEARAMVAEGPEGGDGYGFFPGHGGHDHDRNDAPDGSWWKHTAADPTNAEDGDHTQSAVHITLSATFGDYQDGSENHFLLIEAKEGWTYDTVNIGGVELDLSEFLTLGADIPASATQGSGIIDPTGYYYVIPVGDESIVSTSNSVDGQGLAHELATKAVTLTLYAPDENYESGGNGEYPVPAIAMTEQGYNGDGQHCGPGGNDYKEFFVTGALAVDSDADGSLVAVNDNSLVLGTVGVWVAPADGTFHVTGQQLGYEDPQAIAHDPPTWYDPFSTKDIDLDFQFKGADDEVLDYIRIAVDPNTPAKVLLFGHEAMLVSDGEDGSYYIIPADYKDHVTLMPAKDSDVDVNLKVTAVFHDPDSGDAAMRTVDHTVFIDAVADKPVDLDSSAQYIPGPSAADPHGTMGVTLSATFGDVLDGSEKHYLGIEMKSGWTYESGGDVRWINGVKYMVYEVDPNNAGDAAKNLVLGVPDTDDRYTTTFKTIAIADEVNTNGVEWNPLNNEAYITDTLRVTVDGADGCLRISGSGYEDRMPNAHDDNPFNDSPQAIKLNIGFDNADNEVLDSVTVKALGQSFTIVVDGVQTHLDSGDSINVAGSKVNSVYIIPEADNANDIRVQASATIRDPDSGDLSVRTDTSTIVIDAVADKPTDLHETVNYGAGHDAIDPPGSATVNVTATFGDVLDGSERHYIGIEVKSGWNYPSGGSEQWINGVKYKVYEVTSMDDLGTVTKSLNLSQTNNTDDRFTTNFKTVAIAIDSEVGFGDDDLTSSNDKAYTFGSVDVTVDGADGCLTVNSGNGGFEDWMPDAHDGDMTIMKTALNIGFTPDENEVVDSLVIKYDGRPFTLVVGSGPGATEYVLDGTSGHTSVTLTGTDLAQHLYVKTPLNSDKDIPIEVTANYHDPNSGDTGSSTVDHTVKIDAVADKPTVSIDVNDSGDGGSSFQLGESGTVHVTASFADTDGSEKHSLVLNVPTGFNVTNTDGGSWDPGARTITWLASGPNNSGGSIDKTITVVQSGAVEGDRTFTATAKAQETNTSGSETDNTNNTSTSTATDTANIHLGSDIHWSITDAANVSNIVQEGDLGVNGPPLAFTVGYSGYALQPGETASIQLTGPAAGSTANLADFTNAADDFAAAVQAAVGAVSGISYNAATNTLTFSAGAPTSLTFFAKVYGDTVIESDEKLVLTIQDPHFNGHVGGTVIDGTEDGFIIDDDTPSIVPPTGGGEIGLSVQDVGAVGSGLTDVDTDHANLDFTAGSLPLTFSFDIGAGHEPIVTGLSTTTPISWSIDGGTGNLIGSIDGHPAIILTLAPDAGSHSAGDTVHVNVEVTLVDPLLHADGSTDIVVSGIKVTATDTASNSASGTVSVSVDDDGPTAVSEVDDYTGGMTTNLIIMLDRSGSMAYDSGVDKEGPGNYTRWEVAKQGVQELIDAYADLGSVNVKIVDFYGGTAASSTWYYDAKSGTVTYLDGKNPTGGTNYEAATNTVMADVANGMPPADKSVVYFLSDGNPDPAERGLSGNEIDNWESFLAGTPIDAVYAFGIADSVNMGPLGTVAWTRGGEDKVVVVDDLNDFSQALLDTVPVTGNLLANETANDTVGADGGLHLHSVTVDGTTYFDPAGPGTEVTIDLGDGKGWLKVDFDDGSYLFTPGSNPTGTEVISYEVRDADGSPANANLTLNLRPTELDAHDNYASAQPGSTTITKDTFQSGYDSWSTDDDYYGDISRPNVGGDRELMLELSYGAGSAVTSSKTFDVTANDTLSFSWRAEPFKQGSNNLNPHDDDKFEVVITGPDGTVTKVPYTSPTSGASGNGNFTHTFGETGKYTVTLRVVDGQGNNNPGYMRVYVDDVMFTHAVMGAALIGNVVTDASAAEFADQIGGQTAYVTEVNGVALPTTGAYLEIEGDYGTLRINHFGQYEYHANADTNGHDDAFVYKLAGTTSDYATLNVHIGDAAAPATPATPETDYHMDASDKGFHLGTTSGDTIHGTDGNDVIFGNYGNDTIHGNAGHDILHGNAGDDTIYGDAGNDTLIGGQGEDTLHGGAGADTFMWNAEDFTTSAVDRVTDFNMGDGDVLRFSDVLIGNNPDVVAGGALAGTDANDVVVTLHSGANVQHVVIQDALVGAPDTSAALNAIEQHILNNKIITENS